MLFRQLLDPETSTWSYLLADSETREALLVDPVFDHHERDAELIRELGLTLRVTVETHVHADHMTGSGRLRELFGSEVVVGAATGVTNADRLLPDGEVLTVGGLRLEVRHTPGHTNGCVTWVCHEHAMAFTGDALLVRGCGRTDFQEGSAATLFHSVRERILSLPEETLLYPGHDYKGRTVTTVGEELRFNPRLGLHRSLDDFVAIMGDLRLAPPARMKEVVPANLISGLVSPEPAPHTVAQAMESLGRQDAEIWQGYGI